MKFYVYHSNRVCFNVVYLPKGEKDYIILTVNLIIKLVRFSAAFQLIANKLIGKANEMVTVNKEIESIKRSTIIYQRFGS